MNLLFHVCCGPCALYPLSVFKKTGIDVCCYFFNPNIHPYKEFRKRIEALSIVSSTMNFKVIYNNNYGLVDFLRKVVFHEKNRCQICYDIRLKKTVEYAKNQGYDSFSTSLFYSRYQNHQTLIDICSQLAIESGIQFFYRDFRDGWQSGIDQAKALNIYRQSYCGCIYSEQESHDKKLRKHLLQQKKTHPKEIDE
jgi:epoxyqueuosine reductase